MKQTKHKIKRTFITVMTVVCALSSVAAISASANNCSDTEDTYAVGGYAYKYTDAARRKEDYSSSYQKCISSTVTYQSWVFASKTAYPGSAASNHVTLTYKGKTTPSYYFSSGTIRYMVNYINEYNDLQSNGADKYLYAGMTFWTGSTKGGSTHIRWSPDSV